MYIMLCLVVSLQIPRSNSHEMHSNPLHSPNLQSLRSVTAQSKMPTKIVTHIILYNHNICNSGWRRRVVSAVRAHPTTDSESSHDPALATPRLLLRCE
jgi:hypothetical protein